MNTKKMTAILLIMVSLFLGFQGFSKLDNSGASVEILGAELEVEDKKSKQDAYIYLGLGLVSLLAGVSLIKKQ